MAEVIGTDGASTITTYTTAGRATTVGPVHGTGGTSTVTATSIISTSGNIKPPPVDSRSLSRNRTGRSHRQFGRLRG